MKDSKTTDLIIIPTSFILHNEIRDNGKAKNFSPYTIYNHQTDKLNNIATSIQEIQQNLDVTFISPTEYINKFHNGKLSRSSTTYVVDTLQTLNGELNDCIKNKFQKLRNLKMEATGRRFAIFYHLYLLESIIYYLDSILAQENIDLKTAMGCHYFLHVYFLEDLLPPTTQQKKFFIKLKGKTKVVLEKFLKIPNIVDDTPCEITRLGYLFEKFLVTYMESYSVFCFEPPQICFMNVLFRRYFKEFLELTQPTKTIITEEQAKEEDTKKKQRNKKQANNEEINQIEETKEKNSGIINLTNHLKNRNMLLTGKNKLYAYYKTTTKLAIFLKYEQYIKNSADWSVWFKAIKEAGITYSIPVEPNERTKVNSVVSIDEFLVDFEIFIRDLNFKVICLRSIFTDNLNKAFCATANAWYYRHPIDKQISRKQKLCLNFCAIDSIIDFVYELVCRKFYIRDRNMETLVFGAFVHLSCIEETLDRRFHQNAVIIRVKTKCFNLLKTVFDYKMILTREPTFFFELNFASYVESQKNVLDASSLILLNYKIARYKMEYFHFTGHSDD